MRLLGTWGCKHLGKTCFGCFGILHYSTSDFFKKPSGFSQSSCTFHAPSGHRQGFCSPRCWCQGRSPDGVRHALTVSSTGMLFTFIAHGFILPKSLGTRVGIWCSLGREALPISLSHLFSRRLNSCTLHAHFPFNDFCLFCVISYCSWNTLQLSKNRVKYSWLFLAQWAWWPGTDS